MKYISQTMDFTSYKNGKYITTITDQYYMSTSVDELIGGSWIDIVDNATLPIEKRQYRFRRQKYVWSDGNTTYSAARLDETDQRIMDWCMDNNTTRIDGAKIYTGTITADKINTTDLHAEYIEVLDDSGNIVFKADRANNEVQINKVTATEGTVGGWQINEDALVSAENTMGFCPDPSVDILPFPSIAANSDEWNTVPTTATIDITFPSVNQKNVIPLAIATGTYRGSAYSSSVVSNDLSMYTKCAINGVTIGASDTEIITETTGVYEITRSASFKDGVLTLYTSASRESPSSDAMNFLVPVESMSATLSYNAYTITVNLTYTLNDSIDKSLTIYMLGLSETGTAINTDNESQVILKDGNAELSLKYAGGDTVKLYTTYTAMEKADYTAQEIAISNNNQGKNTCAIWVGDDEPMKAPFQVFKDGTVKVYKGSLEINNQGNVGMLDLPGTARVSLDHDSCQFITTTALSSESTTISKVGVGNRVDFARADYGAPCVVLTSSLSTKDSINSWYSELDSDMLRIGNGLPDDWYKPKVELSLDRLERSQGNESDAYGQPFTVKADSLNLTTRIYGSTTHETNTLRIVSLASATILEPITTHASLPSEGVLLGTWLAENCLAESSDRNLKNSIELLSDHYSVLFDHLNPVRFKYNSGTSNRYHTGFIAQEVADAIQTAGLTTGDFAAYVRNAGTDTCSIRYGEIIALCVNEIQKLKARVAELENKE